MKVVAQRVQKASVYHEGVEVTAIGSGIVLYIGISKDEKEGGGEWLIDTIRGLLQPDDQVMCLSQFTLFATFKGPKPSFHKAERPAIASLYFDQLIKDIQNALECRVVRGPFGKQLEINLEGSQFNAVLYER